MFCGLLVENLELGGEVYGHKGGGIHAERIDGYVYGMTTNDPLSLGDTFLAIAKYRLVEIHCNVKIMDLGVVGLVALTAKEIKWRREITYEVRPNQTVEVLFRGEGLDLLAASLRNAESTDQVVLVKNQNTKPYDVSKIPPNILLESDA